MQQQYHQFSNELIEDEFNELNAGLLDAEGHRGDTEHLTQQQLQQRRNGYVRRSLIIELSGTITPERRNPPTPNLSKVDFTKLAAGASNAGDANMNSDVASPIQQKATFRTSPRTVDVSRSKSNG